MRMTLVLFCIAFSLGVIAGPDSVEVRYAATITAGELENHLTILASDEMEGRETGFDGQKMAAAYIVKQFKSFGIPEISSKELLLPNGYEQSFDLELKQPGGLSIKCDGASYEFLDDMLFFNKEAQESKTFENMLFAGYGLRSVNHNDLAGLNCDGCMMMVMSGLPKNKGGQSKVEVEGQPSEMQLMNLKSKAAAELGAEVLLVVTDRISGFRGQFGNFLRSSRMKLLKEEKPQGDSKRIQTIMISEDMADALLRKGGTSLSKETKKLVRKGPRSRVLNVSTDLLVDNKDAIIQSENVLGYVEGSDKKDELLVITAHYDHVGVMDGKVFNGADDDGSGTVAVLELAQAFAQAKADGHGPRRSVLFMTVSGEEKGLLGSEYYSDNPVFPLENTIADLNVDMIGRYDEEHADSADYVYIIGSDRLSTDLHKINEEANEKHVGLALDYTFNAPDDPNRFYYRSDHYNFAKKGIPVIFYFTGVHEDYHQPGDDVEKIRFDLLEKRTRLIFHTAWELANREKRIVVDGEVE